MSLDPRSGEDVKINAYKTNHILLFATFFSHFLHRPNNMQPIPHNNAGPTNNTFSSIMDDPGNFLEQGGVISLRIPLLNHPQNANDNKILRKTINYTKPKLSTRSTALFLSTLSALLLYFFTFGAVARDVHEAELVIERVRATAGELKDIIVQAASEGTPIKTNFLLFLGGFDYRLEDRTKDGRWEFVPNLHHRWMIFSHRFLRRCERILLTIMGGFMCVSFSFSYAAI